MVLPILRHKVSLVQAGIGIGSWARMTVALTEEQSVGKGESPVACSQRREAVTRSVSQPPSRLCAASTVLTA